MKGTASILFIALLLWMSGSSYWYVKYIGETTEASAPSEEANQSELLESKSEKDPEIAGAITVQGLGTELVIQSDISFVEGNIDATVSEEVRVGLNEIYEHLDEYTTHGIEITGSYSEAEENNSLLNNLGMARAQSIKNIFMKMGLDQGQIATVALESDRVVVKDGVSSGVIGLKVFEIEELSEEDRLHLAHIEKQLRAENQLVCFEPAENELALDDEQKRYFSELSLFMHHHAHHSITLVGHTDELGSEKYNDKLGLERAEFVKSALVEVGINGDQIKTISKGEHELVTPDETDEDRMKERRVEIIMN